MADVDRGQLFLVAALAFATILLILAVLLNSVIYTGSVATRDDGTSSTPAIEYEGTAVSVTTDRIHDVTYGPNEDAATSELTSYVASWQALRDEHEAARGAAGSVTVDPTPGVFIYHTNESREFESGGETQSDEWTLVEDAPIRNHTATVDPNVTYENESLPGEDLFWIEVTNENEDEDDDVWVTRVGRHALDGGGVSTCVVTETPSGTEHRECREQSSLSFSLTNGTIENEPNEAVAYLEAGERYDIRYVNGDQATGAYGFVAGVSQSSLDDAMYDGQDASTSPAYSDAVYDATVVVDYGSADVRHHSERRVAPEEPGGDDDE